MKKSLVTSLFFSFAFLLSAAPLPDQWDAWYWKTDDKQFLKCPTPHVREFKALKDVKRVTLQMPQAGFDFNKLAQGWDAALVRGYIHSKKAETMWLGVGCRIFSVAVNGKIVYDIRYKGLGNDYEPVTVNDHTIALPLIAGKNEISIATKRTNFLQDYCYGANRKIEWRLVLKEQKEYQPVKAELAYPEMVLRPGNNSVMFSFITKQPVPAGIDYRVKGTKNWKREWDLAGDFVLREKSRLHRILLSDLPSGKDLEYRIVLLEPPAGLDGMRRALWTKRQYREVFQPVKTLRNPDRKEFSFFVLGDTQLSLSTTCQTVAARAGFMRKMRALPEYKKSDFIVHVGDADSYAHDIERDLLKKFFLDFVPGQGEAIRPWVWVHGNHEVNGLASEDWYDHFQMPGEKSYYSFRLGDVLFIVLDCGDYPPKDAGLSSYNGPVIIPGILYEKQKKWLEKLQKTEAFRTAKFRIVLAHPEPQIDAGYLEDKMREITAPLLRNDSDDSRIHLWIAGHVHRYWRAAKGTSELIARTPRKKTALKKSPVNWVSVDGPKGNSSNPNFSYLHVKVTADKIAVKAVDENGKTLDEFQIDQKGQFRELYRGEELKAFPFGK